MRDRTLERQLARRAYHRRVLQQPDSEKARVHALEARLVRYGIAADLVGIPQETARELVVEWERLVAAYPAAARLWQSVGPDVELVRLDGRQWLGYRAGVMLWHPGQLTRPRMHLIGELGESVRKRHSPPGCGTLAAVACHEFGHVLEDHIRTRLGDLGATELSYRLAGRDLSVYTERDPQEAVAVAFAAMHHGRGLGSGPTEAVAALSEVLERLGVE